MTVTVTEWPHVSHIEARDIYQYLHTHGDASMEEIAAGTDMDIGVVHSHLLHYEPTLWYRESNGHGDEYYHARDPQNLRDIDTTKRITVEK